MASDNWMSSSFYFYFLKELNCYVKQFEFGVVRNFTLVKRYQVLHVLTQSLAKREIIEICITYLPGDLSICCVQYSEFSVVYEPKKIPSPLGNGNTILCNCLFQLFSFLACSRSIFLFLCSE